MMVVFHDVVFDYLIKFQMENRDLESLVRDVEERARKKRRKCEKTQSRKADNVYETGVGGSSGAQIDNSGVEIDSSKEMGNRIVLEDNTGGSKLELGIGGKNVSQPPH